MLESPSTKIFPKFNVEFPESKSNRIYDIRILYVRVYSVGEKMNSKTYKF